MENNLSIFFTVFFAGLSAIFAGISAWLLFLEYRRNNPKIKVLMTWAIAGMYSGTRELIQLRIENHGRRKIILSSWAFLTSDGKNFILFEDSDVFIQRGTFPYVLEEQGMCSILLDKVFLEEAIKHENVRLLRLDFSDTIGNIYSYKLKKKFWKDLM